MALGWFELFSIISFHEEYSRPYGIWLILLYRIRFSRYTYLYSIISFLSIVCIVKY